MEFFLNYWWIGLIILAALAVIGVFVFKFLKLPTKEQIAKVKEWLLYAVTEAEKELGGGTGQVKLRFVYDMFITKFGLLAKMISFDRFSILVDEVLETFREMLKTNESLNAYVVGQTTTTE